RSGYWKLIEKFESGEDELFHLGDDPSESKNVASLNPETVALLKNRLAAWRTNVGTKILD
ncbi:MAG: sulfatase, partial [Verrucomicrobiales bacterium]